MTLIRKHNEVYFKKVCFMSFSRRDFLGTSAAAASAIGFTSFSSSTQASYMPEARRMAFKVSANGKNIGEHLIKFEMQNTKLHVKSSVDVAVKLAGFTAFYYRLLAHEVWKDGKLVQLKSKSDMNGKENKLVALAKPDGLLIQSNNKRFTASSDTLPTSYWNPSVLQKSRLLNMQTGKLTAVRSAKVGSDKVTTAGVPTPADRYRVTGDVSMVLWYSQNGEWSAGSFQMQGHRVTFMRDV